MPSSRIHCLAKHHVVKTYWRSGGIAPRIPNFATSWRWVVSFTPWPLYPQWKNACYPLDRRLGGPQGRSGHGDEGKKFHHSCRQELNTGRPARSTVSILTEPPWLLYSFNKWDRNFYILSHFRDLCKRSQEASEKAATRPYCIRAWCERWNIKINEDKNQAIYFSHWRR
jgi:hypothetical protein